MDKRAIRTKKPNKKNTQARKGAKRRIPNNHPVTKN